MEATEPKTEDQWAESLLATPESEDTATDVEEADNDQTEEAPDDFDADEQDVAEETDDAEIDGDEFDQTDEDNTDDADQEEHDSYIVKVDGVDQRVTLDDLKRSFSGQAYIQKGMQEVAAKRKEAEAVYEQLTQDRESLSQLVTQLQQGGAIPEPQAPDIGLMKTDPIGYFESKAIYDQQKAQYDAQREQLGAAMQQQTEAQKQAFQAYVNEQRQLLERAIPEFADPQKGAAVRTAIRKVGESYGFSEQELSNVVDARVIQVLNDARKYRELESGKAKKKVEKARPVLTPKAKSKVNAKEASAKALERLRKSGSEDAALAYIMQSGE